MVQEKRWCSRSSGAGGEVECSAGAACRRRGGVWSRCPSSTVGQRPSLESALAAGASAEAVAANLRIRRTRSLKMPSSSYTKKRQDLNAKLR